MSKEAPHYPAYHPGEHFTCPKCSSRDKKVVHCHGRTQSKMVSGKWVKTFDCTQEWEGEHMHLQCARCGYAVPREPMDSYVRREGMMPTPQRPIARSNPDIEEYYRNQVARAVGAEGAESGE